MFFLLLKLNKNIQKDTNDVIKVVPTQLNRYSTVANPTVHETPQPLPPQTAAAPGTRGRDSRTSVRGQQNLRFGV